MKQILLNIVKSILAFILSAFLITIIVCNSEYRAEKAAIQIYKEQQLNTCSEQEAKQWVNQNIITSTTHYYLFEIINSGYCPDTIYFFKSTNYNKYYEKKKSF